MDVFDMMKSSTDKASFLKFLEGLENDFLNNSETWENLSIDMFLEAIRAWIYQGNDVNFENPDWTTVASIFYSGKVYE